MAPSDVAVRPRRSAFAAAFLSFIFPGLGHAYLGRWLRALLWAALPMIGLAAGAGLVFSSDSQDIYSLADPEVLTYVLAFLAFDVIYRLIAMLDAFRLATDASIGNAGTRVLSMAGLAALVVALVGSHVVVARPIVFYNETWDQISRNSGDDSEIADLAALAAENPDFVVQFEELQQVATPDPESTPGDVVEAIAPATPEAEPTEAVATPQPEPAVKPTPAPKRAEWDGKKRLNILLIGTDGGRQGRAANSFLTDTMITVSVDPTTGRVAFISLPRDASGIPLPSNWGAYSAYGGKYNNKINTLYTVARGSPGLFPGSDKHRGYEALMGALGKLYGLEIDYYIAVDLNSFRGVVNALDGVVVDVQLPVQDDHYGADDGRGHLKLYVPPGMSKMNGQQALAYARSRHGSSDFNRSARQQRIITSVRDQTDLESLLEPGVINSLIKQLQKEVKTNIPAKLVPKLVSLARDIDLDRRENLVLDSYRYMETCYPCGAQGLWMLKSKPAAIKEDVRNIFSTSRKAARAINRIEEEGAVVHVLNGQGGRNTKANNIAEHLANKGVDAAVPPVNDGKADKKNYTGTVITVYNSADKSMPETFSTVKRTFQDKRRQIVRVDDPAAPADIVVVVGSKTESLR